MFNLIKKDIITTITSNKKSNLQYLFILLFLYTILNLLSYFTANIIISYLILINTFKNDYENNSGNFILSMGVNKEDVVYSKYILSFILIIGTSILNSTITWILGGIFYRGPVLNDILISNIIFLFIISMILPIIFKFGYRKSKLYVGGISMILGVIGFSLLTLISDRIYNNTNGIEVSYVFYGPFTRLFEYITQDLNTRYINLYTIGFVISLVFILSIYLSIRIIKGENIIDMRKFLIIVLMTVLIFEGYVFINKKIYGNMLHMEDYDIVDSMETEIKLDGYKEIEEGTLIRIKIINQSKYTYILEDISLNLGENVEFEDGSVTFAPYISLDYYEGDFNNSQLMQEGIEPKGKRNITFLMPKGLILQDKSFDFNHVNIDSSFKFIVDLPIIKSLIPVSSGGGSNRIDYMNIDNN